MEESPLTPACSDAALLVTHLMQEGVPISQETLTAIEVVQHNDPATPLPADAKTKFVAAYSEIAKLASPVSAESLRACSENCAKPWKRWPWSVPKEVSEAERAVLRHHTWGAVALATLLCVQIYWLIGATLITGVKRQDRDVPGQAEVSPTPAPSPETTPEPTATSTGEAEAREDTHVWLLNAWSAVWRWVPALYQRWFPDDQIKSNRFWELSIGTKFVLEIIQTYLLPLLYGWVGSMAFVLRSLIVTVKNKSFRPELNVEYRLRVYLGVLAGLVIGWFLSGKTGSQTSVANLAPAAVSFVAGYSVEILFSTMDRLVAGFVTAFGGSTIQTPQTPKT
jgi:hypothetical protein